MESIMGFKNQRKPRRRSTHRRKLLLSDSPMDMAEARREIVNALQIHRSSSTRDTNTNYQQNSLMNYNNTSRPSLPTAKDTSNINIITTSQLCYPLVESVQLPEPIWSTTEPAALVAPPAPPPLPIDQVFLEEFEWAENNDMSHSSSYTWWLGFLKSLDSGNDGYSCQLGNFPARGSEMDTVSSGQIEQISPCPETYEWLSTITGTAASEDEVEFL